ncbi:MAG: toll/interleukin-1 receptor domain-containing protein [Lachnospiraceae bacterium]|nr:toll/interleukin-1 receptor domain-containing protein [Lachnospiraceae bacterium]
MAEKIVKYDAFISYRHSELDKFVAVNLHKKLEAFKLPKGVKSPTGKKKIERVFRDQDELPLASNLGDPITLALENSDYLLVICTPRLPQSEWCKKEIETFIKLHGRDKVLAVLAEGEPEESFPEALIKEEYEVIKPDGTKEIQYRTFEPLAADVRGKSNKAIKKAMNDAVLRICAAIFGLNYDELKQRHKERAMKRTISVVSAVAAALMLFSAVCLGLMFKIINQSEMILDQNAEITQQYNEIQAQSEQIKEQNEQIQEQYTQSQINLAKATTINAEKLLSMGRSRDSVYALRQVMPESSKDDSYPYTAETEYALTNSLELYSNPGLYYSDRTFESESTIKILKVSPDLKKLATLDSCNNFHIWDSETGEEIFYKVITNASLHNEHCFKFIDDSTIVYFENYHLYRLNLNDLSETEIATPFNSRYFNGAIIRLGDTGMFAVFTEEGFALFKVENSELIAVHTLDEYLGEDIKSQQFEDITLSTDKTKLIFSVEKGLKQKSAIIVYDIDTDTIKAKEVSVDNCSALSSRDNEIYFVGFDFGSNLFLSSDSVLMRINLETLKTEWETVSPGTVYDLKTSLDYKYVFAAGFDSLYIFDAENGDLADNKNSNSKIIDVCPLSGNNARVITSDCYARRFIDGFADLSATDLFNNTPNLRTETIYYGNSKLFLMFENKTYISLFRFRELTDTPFMENCNFSNVMLVNDAGTDILRTNENMEIYRYSTETNNVLYAIDPKNTNYTLVGDGSEMFAAYGNSLEIFNISDGSLVKEVPSLDCPLIDENAVTNDRLYIYTGRDYEDHIFLYSLTTGKVEEVLKPDIPSDEKITVYGLDRDHYAVRRESGALEVYRGKETKPVFTSSRILSFMDDIRVFYRADVFAITYFDGSTEFYRFGDTCEPVQTYNSSDITSASIDEAIYYPDQKIYVLNLSQNTVVLNENLEAVTYMPMKTTYIPSKDFFVYHNLTNNALYTIKHYSYDDLIHESDRILNDYNPSKLVIDKYNLID